MSMTEAYPRLMAALDEVRGQWRRQKLLEGALLAFAGVTGVLVALVAADNLLHPGKAGRVLLAAVLWGGLVACLLGLVVRRWLEDRRDDFFAALVEQKHPELHNQLINALQLGRDNQRGFSPLLISAIVEDAGRATLDMEMADSIDTRPTRRAGLWALAALLVVAGYAAALTPRFTNGLSRVLLPGSDIAPYTRTRIVADSIKPGNSLVAEGEQVPISVTVEGVIPPSAELRRRVGKGSWQATVMTADPLHEGTFHFTVMQAAESFEYFIVVGDAESETFRIDVVKPPAVAKLALTYTLPPYAAQAPRRVLESDGEISGIAGTGVALELTATKPLKDARLLLKDGRELVLDRHGDDRTWGTSFVIGAAGVNVPAEVVGERLVAPTTYQLKLEDTVGYKNADPLWRGIGLAQDLPPVVVLLAPGDKLSVKPDAKLPVVVKAQDDFGLGAVRLFYKVKNDEKVHQLAVFPHKGAPRLQTSDAFRWELAASGLKVGDLVEYWAEAVDRNTITGPGKAESRHFFVEVIDPLQPAKQPTVNLSDYVGVVKALLKLQRENRTDTAEARPFGPLVAREVRVRDMTRLLARTMEKDSRSLASIVKALDGLAAGPMAEALKFLEAGKDAKDEALSKQFRARSLPVQDDIIKKLEDLLARLQRNEEARKALKRMEKKDPKTAKALKTILTDLIKNLGETLKDQTELAGKFERLPKKGADEMKEERLKALKDLDDLKKRTQRWAKGSVNEMTKLPTGFTDDFGLRKDVNKIFEEIEKAETRAKAAKLEVSLEDLGAGLATKMKEDLEMWLPDAADSTKWVLEEPLNKKPMKIPEMPLPKALEDLVSDLLQKADEFDEEADDITSAWGDNLDQAGWGVSDGPISTFSAKGKTGNDQPNNMELNGRSGDGRRGKSTGQMVGDTSKGLPGRKTPARVGNEKYEPGKLKQQGQEDPNGATGGGKKAGAGRKGLQGGTPPDMARDMGRLSKKQAGLREKAEQVARKLDTVGVSTRRLTDSIELMKSVEKDLADHRYDDAFRKRREALRKMRSAFSEMDQSTSSRIHRARDLPPQLRKELLQSSEEGYPAGYEGLLKSYYKALSTAEK